MESGSLPDAERTILGAIMPVTAARGAERDSVVGESSSRGDRGMGAVGGRARLTDCARCLRSWSGRRDRKISRVR